MASKRQKQIVTQPETQDTLMIPEGFGNTPYLPHDIIVSEVLTRVPVDSLMRFKCVCKYWLSLISNDSEFIKLYSRQFGNHGFIQLSPSYPDDDNEYDYLCGVIKSNGMVYYNIDKKEKKVYHFRPETGLFNSRLRIQDSLNGLVLFSRQEDGECFTQHVFNPITGYSIQLPVIKARGSTGKRYFHLAYDAVNEKFKVVCCYQGKQWFIFKIVTVDAKNDSWRYIVAPSYPRLVYAHEVVFANGCLNWWTHRYGGGDQGKILSLDVSKEKFYPIDYPKGVSDASKLMEMGGSLCFFDYVSMTGKIKLWVLKEKERKQRKQSQHDEWLEYNVDLLQNNNLPETFNDFKNDKCVAIVKDPTLKIIFWHTNVRIFDEPNERGVIRYYTPECHSYDVESKMFALISEPKGIFVKWDLNSLVHFQSTFAGMC
ncbi:hypothetical protein MKW94_011975 [Papaver nudicaule]|uniref:F-box domain-containing protein n=1 Tax=Papaver nudicaule TaxID=74823 RepID=A0AA41VX44_PAPNU|nr:hypothetical protein [Papaver nudicaule]